MNCMGDSATSRVSEMRALWAACEETTQGDLRVRQALAELQPRAQQLRAQLGAALEAVSRP